MCDNLEYILLFIQKLLFILYHNFKNTNSGLTTKKSYVKESKLKKFKSVHNKIICLISY